MTVRRQRPKHFCVKDRLISTILDKKTLLLTSYSSMLTSSGLIRSSLARATFIMLLHLLGGGGGRRETGRGTGVSDEMVSHCEVLQEMKESTLPLGLNMA